MHEIVGVGHTLGQPVAWSVLCYWYQVTHPEVFQQKWKKIVFLFKVNSCYGVAQVIFTCLGQVKQGFR